MLKWSTRTFASVGIVAVVVAFSVAVANAAAPGPSATADAQSAHSTALGTPGSLTVSESDARTDQDPTWSAASLGGTSLIGKNSNGWSGAAAALGALIDALNVVLCPTPVAIDPTTVLSFCANLLPSYANVSTDDGVTHSETGGSLAQVGAAAISNDDTLVGGGLDVLPSQAAADASDCPMNSSLAGLLTIAVGTGVTDIQRLALGQVEAHAPACSP